MVAVAIGVAALLLALASINGARLRHALAYCGSVALVIVAVVSAAGQPRPDWFGHKPGIALLAMTLDEGHAIYVWTRDGDAPPVAYAMPWDEQAAADAQNALRQAAAAHTQARWGGSQGGGSVAGNDGNGTGARAQGGISGAGGSFASVAGFYAAAQPALQPKTKP